MSFCFRYRGGRADLASSDMVSLETTSRERPLVADPSPTLNRQSRLPLIGRVGQKSTPQTFGSSCPQRPF